VTLREITLRYQHYNPTTGRFDLARSKFEYATLLGVDPTTLSRIIHGQQAFSLGLARGLARAFPELEQPMVDLILGREPELVA
jgi:hypothetical protein